MRNPSDYPNQEPRTTLGDHDNPPITASATPRFTLDRVADERFPAQPEWARNMAIYGGLVGETDEPGLVSRVKIKRLRDVIGQLLEAQSSALYTTRTAMALIESADVLQIKDKIDALHFSSQRTMDECARLIACGEKEQR
jgi:hypothetical protein